MAFKTVLVGFDGFVATLKNTIPTARSGMKRQTRKAAQSILEDILNTRPGAGVPRDTNKLAQSGRIEDLGRGGYAIIFGGPAVDYALIQHENLTFHHEQGEAQYVTNAMERWAGSGSSLLSAGAALALRELIKEVTR